MVNQQSAIITVRSFAKNVVKSGIDLKKVILFGSFASGWQHEHSDIDVALVADEFSGVGYEDIKLFVKTLRNYIQIQPKTYPTEYFEKGDPFIDEILKSGIEIPLE